MESIPINIPTRALKYLIKEAVKEVLEEDVLPHIRAEAKGYAIDQLLTRNSAGELLDVTPETIDRYARRGLLKKHYLGGSVRFNKREVLEFLTNNNSEQNE